MVSKQMFQFNFVKKPQDASKSHDSLLCWLYFIDLSRWHLTDLQKWKKAKRFS